MMRGLLAAAMAAMVAGCTTGPEDGGGNGGGQPAGAIVLKKYPSAGDWVPAESPGAKYPAGAAELDIYAGEKISGQLRANLLDSLLVKNYCHQAWDKAKDEKGNPKPDLRRVRVEIYIHQAPYGAAKTFSEWRSGQSISDVGEKAFAESDAIVFLRGSVVARFVPTKWPPRTAGGPTLEIAKAIDAWLQGK
ncbi:MAG: hypothetical protein IT452_09320 [Planctomycetia bacterium]|nr:hypothetical protein [Planctomycetia bacterium]